MMKKTRKLLMVKAYAVMRSGNWAWIKEVTYKDRKSFYEEQRYLFNTLGTVNNFDSVYEDEEDALYRMNMLRKYFIELEAYAN